MASTLEKSKKTHVHLESEKARHTSHWDMDYLPLKELKSLYRRRMNYSDRRSLDSPSYLRLKRRLGWALVASALAMLALVALIGRGVTG